MGTVATRCLKGCEGGKKEVGEENLENIINSDMKNEDKYNNSNELTAKVREFHNPIEEKLIEDYKCKKKEIKKK